MRRWRDLGLGVWRTMVKVWVILAEGIKKWEREKGWSLGRWMEEKGGPGRWDAGEDDRATGRNLGCNLVVVERDCGRTDGRWPG